MSSMCRSHRLEHPVKRFKSSTPRWDEEDGAGAGAGAGAGDLYAGHQHTRMPALHARTDFILKQEKIDPNVSISHPPHSPTPPYPTSVSLYFIRSLTVSRRGTYKSKFAKLILMIASKFQEDIKEYKNLFTSDGLCPTIKDLDQIFDNSDDAGSGDETVRLVSVDNLWK